MRRARGDCRRGNRQGPRHRLRQSPALKPPPPDPLPRGRLGQAEGRMRRLRPARAQFPGGNTPARHGVLPRRFRLGKRGARLRHNNRRNRLLRVAGESFVRLRKVRQEVSDGRRAGIPGTDAPVRRRILPARRLGGHMFGKRRIGRRKAPKPANICAGGAHVGCARGGGSDSRARSRI